MCVRSFGCRPAWLPIRQGRRPERQPCSLEGHSTGEPAPGKDTSWIGSIRPSGGTAIPCVSWEQKRVPKIAQKASRITASGAWRTGSITSSSWDVTASCLGPSLPPPPTVMTPWTTFASTRASSSYLKPKRVLSPSSSVMSGDGRVSPNLSNHSWICGISAAHSSVET
jgi:hypothetical protein